jgi:hypothetical protein
MDTAVNIKLIFFYYFNYFLGSLVSQFVASNFINLLTHMKSYKLKKYEQALIETYLKFDELLRMEKINQLLITQYNSIQSGTKLEISFHFQVEENSGNNVEKLEIYGDDNNSKRNLFKRSFGNGENIHEGFPNPRRKGLDINSEPLSQNIEKDILEEMENTNTFANSIMKIKLKNKKEDPLGSTEDQKVEISFKKNSTDTTKTTNYSSLIAKDMGTTANILLIKNNLLYLANVGDSMAVIFKNGQAIRLNQEHKTTLPAEYARVTKSGAKIINNRIEGKLNLTRAIGKNLI